MKTGPLYLLLLCSVFGCSSESTPPQYNEDFRILLLSSQASERYREDILRCLALPLGTRIQFRYERAIVSEEVKKAVDAGNLAEKLGRRALVCFLDNQVKTTTDHLTITPIRAVTIESSQSHGTTISFRLVMNEFVHSKDPAFTDQIVDLSGSLNPKGSKDKGIEGNWVLPIKAAPKNLERGQTVVLWEKIVAALHQKEAFMKEPFYWTVLRTIDAGGTNPDLNTCSQWRGSYASGDEFDVLVYHYLPGEQEPKTKQSLSLSVGQHLELVTPAKVLVDSRYDLKSWRLRAKDVRTKEDNWLILQMDERYAIDLPMKVSRSTSWALFLVLVITVLFALPHVQAAFQKEPVKTRDKFILATCAIFVGLVTAVAIVYGIKPNL